MKDGFSLVELLISMSIVAILSSIAFASLRASVSKTYTVNTGQTKASMTKAAQLYWIDTGFYPPDVNRGWDPGFMRKDPWNSDIEDGESVPSGYQTPGTDCSHCPINWQDILDQSWNGPYLSEWPDNTPWGGEYDYNYWPSGATRNGCAVSPGIYAGAQGNYTNDANSLVPAESELELVNFGLDNDGCVNGESQLRLHELP